MEELPKKYKSRAYAKRIEKEKLKIGDLVFILNVNETRIFLNYGNNGSIICVGGEIENVKNYHNGEEYNTYKWNPGEWRLHVQEPIEKELKNKELALRSCGNCNYMNAVSDQEPCLICSAPKYSQWVPANWREWI